MSLTKDEAAELKRLIADAGKAVWDEATLNVNTRSSWQCNKALHTYIDSLTQPAPDLTDAEVVSAMYSAKTSSQLDSFPSLIDMGRSVIAAHEAKRSRQ